MLLIQDGGTLREVLGAQPQELLRAGQVRAFLALTRDEGTPRDYERDLRAALDPAVTRSHIRAAVYSALKEQKNDALAVEFDIVLQRALDAGDPMRARARHVLASPAFATILASRRLLEPLVARFAGYESLGERNAFDSLDEQETAHLLTLLTRSSPDVTAASLQPSVSQHEQIHRRLRPLLQFIFMAGPTDDGTQIVALFVKVMEAVADVATAPPPDDFHEAAQQYGMDDAAALVRRLVEIVFGDEGKKCFVDDKQERSSR